MDFKSNFICCCFKTKASTLMFVVTRIIHWHLLSCANALLQIMARLFHQERVHLSHRQDGEVCLQEQLMETRTASGVENHVHTQIGNIMHGGELI